MYLVVRLPPVLLFHVTELKRCGEPYCGETPATQSLMPFFLISHGDLLHNDNHTIIKYNVACVKLEDFVSLNRSS